MDAHSLIANLTNPTLLFFGLGLLATALKSDLEIPPTSVKFIALYLLFAIGFKGGQELAHSPFSAEILYSLGFGLLIAGLIPLYTFFVLKRRLSAADAGAIAAAYGSVSAVTFVSAVSFLEAQQLRFGGHMVAVMALMEAPAIIAGVVLMKCYEAPSSADEQRPGLGVVAHHAFTNGSVLLVLGSLLIGLIADTKQADDIKPFTTDIFKGFLAIFLLEMGMVTARRFAAFRRYGGFVTAFAVFVPLLNGCLVAAASHLVTESVGNRFLFAILGASASYIAVPAAMRLVAPRADPGLYLPMALGVTFPLNITVGMPLYLAIVQHS